MSDTHNLIRFIDAQKQIYNSVLQELRNGKKRGHWMWYIFPQIAGLGMSSMSQMYAIKSIDEAKAYDAHPTLGSRLQECTQVVMDVEGRTATEIFGPIDSLKFRSCMTLFEYGTDNPLFHDALVKYFDGDADERTLDILAFSVD